MLHSFFSWGLIDMLGLVNFSVLRRLTSRGILRVLDWFGLFP